jgi:hypothetical protein
MESLKFLVYLAVFLPFNLFSLYLSFEEIGEYRENAVYIDIIVIGKYAFVVAGNDGVHILDVSRPNSPRKISVIESMDYSYAIDIKGFNLYVADGAGGVRIFDVKDKSNPKQISFIPTRYESVDLEVSGDYCFIADEKGGFKIIDISKPVFPDEVSVWDESDYVNSVEVVHDYAYLSDGKGVLGFPIANPDTLGVYKRIGEIESADQIISDGRFLFASSLGNGLLIAEIMDVNHPLVQVLPRYSGIENIYLSGFYLYFTQGSMIGVLNMLIPFNPYPSGNIGLSGNVSAVYVTGNLLYAVCGFDGLKILEISD